MGMDGLFSESTIYLDYNATTPTDPRVREAMAPYLGERFGNPSSAYLYGRQAREALVRARAQVAALLGAQPEEIVFTSGGTEANNMALKGVFFARLVHPEVSGRGRLIAALVRRLAHGLRVLGSRRSGVHIVTSAIEHPATLATCSFLERLGCRITRLPVDRYGVVDLQLLRRVLQQGATLVSIMHSNNEVGTLEPIRDIARLAHAYGALVHTDAAQSVGKLPLHVAELEVDMLSVAGHKLYAPKGVGALYVKSGITLEPWLHGAGQESGRRAGTEAVALIVALGSACELARSELPDSTQRLRSLRDRLHRRLQEAWGERLVLHGHPVERLPNTLNVGFVGLHGAEVLERAGQVAASTGSACHAGQKHMSPVLRAMGVSEASGLGAVRLSVGRYTTEADVDTAAQALVSAARSAQMSVCSP